MPKTPTLPSHALEVTFNSDMGGHEIGECSMNTVDYYGDDVDELVAEVLAGDPNYPMVFHRTYKGNIVGLFIGTDELEDAEKVGADPSPTAVMYYA